MMYNNSNSNTGTFPTQYYVASGQPHFGYDGPNAPPPGQYYSQQQQQPFAPPSSQHYGFPVQHQQPVVPSYAYSGLNQQLLAVSPGKSPQRQQRQQEPSPKHKAAAVRKNAQPPREPKAPRDAVDKKHGGRQQAQAEPNRAGDDDDQVSSSECTPNAIELEQLIKEKKLLIKPFTPANVFRHHCHLCLGQHFYRANPKCSLINPYLVDGLGHGFSDKVHTAVEWRTVREVLKQTDDEIGESDLYASFDDFGTEGALHPDDSCLVLNPLETIMGHTEESIAVAPGYWPVVEAVSDLGRCGIRISLAYTPRTDTSIYRPVLCITNTSRYAKAVLVAGRPVVSLALLQPPQVNFAGDNDITATTTTSIPTQPDPTTPVSEPQLRQFANLWHPTALLNPQSD